MNFGSKDCFTQYMEALILLTEHITSTSDTMNVLGTHLASNKNDYSEVSNLNHKRQRSCKAYDACLIMYGIQPLYLNTKDIQIMSDIQLVSNQVPSCWVKQCKT